MSTTEGPMADHLGDRLSAYVDGELAGDARFQVEEHLTSCTECATLLQELREVKTQAGSLPNVPPPADLWEGVASRLGEQEHAVTTIPEPARVVSMPTRHRGFARRFSFSIPQLAAASIAIAALSGSLVWWGLRSAPTSEPMAENGPPAAAPTVQRAPSESTTTSPTDTDVAPEPARRTSAATPPAATLASFDSPSYDQAVAELQQVLARHRGRLDPRTVQLVESNLAAIDTAIGQARKALIADPSNPYLNGHLAEQMKRKVRVLQQAAELVAVNYPDNVP